MIDGIETNISCLKLMLILVFENYSMRSGEEDCCEMRRNDADIETTLNGWLYSLAELFTVFMSVQY